MFAEIVPERPLVMITVFQTVSSPAEPLSQTGVEDRGGRVLDDVGPLRRRLMMAAVVVVVRSFLDGHE